MENRILIVAAHPDDEVLGCFGTVTKLIRQGYEAYTLILSRGKTSRDGECEDDIKKLAEETIKANELIGIKKIFRLNFPDNAFDTVSLLSIVKEIEKIKKEINPEIIFTHHSGDINIDHQITAKAVLTATRPMKGECVKTIYAMEIPSSTEWNGYSPQTAFCPNVFFDIAESVDLKLKAMKLYQSELREYPHPRSLKYIKDLAALSGAKNGLDYCENFMLIRKIM